MRRLVAVIAAAVLSLVAPVVLAAHASAADTGSMESEFVSRVNSVRAAKGLPALKVDGELTTIGRRWAGKMAAAGRISHNPNFKYEVTQDWVKLGENVGTGPDVKSIHDAFVASATHYANMVDGSFTRIGVGVVIGPNGAIYTAHQFMRLATDDAGVAAAPAPAAAPKPAPAPKPAAPKPAAAPRPAAAPKPAVAKPVVAAPVAPAPVPAPVIVPARIALSLEQSQGLGI
jgi:Cysteine-rich secretory protein family